MPLRRRCNILCCKHRRHSKLHKIGINGRKGHCSLWAAGIGHQTPVPTNKDVDNKQVRVTNGSFQTSPLFLSHTTHEALSLAWLSSKNRLIIGTVCLSAPQYKPLTTNKSQTSCSAPAKQCDAPKIILLGKIPRETRRVVPIRKLQTFRA